jgi:hypothetical protein
MSNQIFKSINNAIEFYENRLINPNNIHLMMFPHLRELALNKVEIFKKLLELVGDKEDKYYEEFYNNNFKDLKLKQMYTFNQSLRKYKFMSFSDINDFLEKIKDYEWIDGKDLMNEIKMALDNIKKLPETKEKETKEKKPKTKKKSISSTIKKLVWNTNIGEDIGKAKCLCCKSTDITQLSFNCGHIIAEANGGDTIVSNLRPICQNCNSSMGTKNMNDFMETLK